MAPPTLAVFTKNRLNPAYDAARAAADRVAAEVGRPDRSTTCRETPDDVGEQKALVAEALAAGVSGVVFNPTDDQAMREDLERFAQAGIPVAIFINRMDGPGADLRRLRRHRDRPCRRQGADRRCRRQGGGKGRIVALDGTPSARTARDRAEGLRRAVAEHPGIELVDAPHRLPAARAGEGRDGRAAGRSTRRSTASGPPTT